ncbi:MAG: xylellain [Bacilli bacterium]|nr:xylellain [Bacilli bacterium]
MSMRKYNLKKEKRDLRDYHFKSLIYAAPIELPKLIDLRPLMSPIVDQGNLGSCTANAIASGLREYLLLLDKQALTRLSRLFLYWHERKLEGHTQEDSGAYIRDGLKVLQKIGVSPEIDFPYDTTHFADKPSLKAETDASNFKINEYHRIPDLYSLKAALAEGLPVVIGIQIYESFESPQVAQTGKVPLPKKTKEKLLGGHALLVVGYADQGTKSNQGFVIVRNSWGEEWGDRGYCYIPYSMFKDAALVMDMWTGK